MKLVILVVEDDPPVRDALVADLAPFGAVARIEVAESAEEASELVADLGRDERLALVLADHRLPGRSGVDFLVGLSGSMADPAVRKVLVTGQADHADTIRAVNDAGLDHYIAKPWDPDDLATVVRDLLSRWVADQVDDVLPYLAHLDSEILLPAVRRHTDPD